VLDAPGAERTHFSARTWPWNESSWFTASGSLTCLRGEGSLIDLRIFSDDKPEEPIAAVVFSFSQVGRPALHRLMTGSPEALAQHLTTLSTDLSTWTHPVNDVEVSRSNPSEPVATKPDSYGSQLPEGLEAQLLRLDLLKHHADDIQKEIKATEAKIMSIWKSEFAKCNSIGCYLKTAVAKAPTLAHLIASHLSHHTHVDADFFRNSTHMNCTMEVEKVVEQHEKQMVLVDLADQEANHEEEVGIGYVPPPDDEKGPEMVEDAPESSTESESSETDTSGDEDTDDTTSWTGGRPPWRHGPPGGGRRPPWAKPGGRPPWANGGKFPFGRPPWAKPGGRPSWTTTENQTPAASGPSDGQGDTTYRFWPFSLTPNDRIKIAAALVAACVVGFTMLTLVFCLCLRRGCMLLRDPRVKADCMARREERRTRRLYRKAACKHRVRTFFQRFKRPFSSSDYEEKRELLVNEDGESAGIMGPQIDRLRILHEFVFGQVTRRTEEGAASAQQTQQAPADPDAAERSSIRSETLPAYSLPPPSYRNGLGSDFSVVTGFTGYTPSGTESTADDQTESSIVDCSPRLSFESQRTGTTRTRD
jgi:hypothetical protein